MAARIAALAGAEEGPSKFGGGTAGAFSLHGREFAHFHGETALDVRLPRAEQKALRGDPRVVFRKSSSDWVEVLFPTRADEDFAFGLVEKAWRAVADEGPRARVKRRAAPSRARSRRDPADPGPA